MASRASRSSQGGKPFSASRTQLGPSRGGVSGQRYPEIKQRGYYSDIIGTDNAVGEVGVSLFLLSYYYMIKMISKVQSNLQ